VGADFAELHVVTGAFGYSGRYIAQALLEHGKRARTLTAHPSRPNPFGELVEAVPIHFDDRAALILPAQPDKLLVLLRGEPRAVGPLPVLLHPPPQHRLVQARISRHLRHRHLPPLCQLHRLQLEFVRIPLPCYLLLLDMVLPSNLSRCPRNRGRATGLCRPTTGVPLQEAGAATVPFCRQCPPAQYHGGTCGSGCCLACPA